MVSGLDRHCHEEYRSRTWCSVHSGLKQYKGEVEDQYHQQNHTTYGMSCIPMHTSKTVALLKKPRRGMHTLCDGYTLYAYMGKRGILRRCTLTPTVHRYGVCRIAFPGGALPEAAYVHGAA